MKNRKRVVVAAFVMVLMVAISVCLVVIVPRLKMGKSSSMTPESVVNKNYENSSSSDENKNKDNKEENQESSGSTNLPDDSETGSENAVTVKNELEFFVYDKAVTKSKEIRGETTMFEISFRVFVTNNTRESKSVLASAFSSSYDVSDSALFYTLECSDDVKNIKVEVGDTQDFNFTLKYVVTDTEKFNISNKNNLSVSYMLKEVVSLNV